MQPLTPAPIAGRPRKRLQARLLAQILMRSSSAERWPRSAAAIGQTLPGKIAIARESFKNLGVPVVVHTTVQLDKEVVGRQVTEVNRKQAKRNMTQRRGRISGR